MTNEEEEGGTPPTGNGQTPQGNGASQMWSTASEETDAEASLVSGDIAALQSQLSDATERHVRLAADFDNYRKRIARERADSLMQAQAGLMTRLLDVLDDLERFAHHSDPNVSSQALQQGVQLIERKMKSVMEGAGLETIDPQNARFDPQTMEGVASVPTDSPDEDDTVSDVFQKGYRFNNVLIRPARVRVRKHD
jgi:molecular chaperone GrpE